MNLKHAPRIYIYIYIIYIYTWGLQKFPDDFCTGI